MERGGMGKREILVAGIKMLRGEEKTKQARDYVDQLLRDVEPSVLVMEERIGEHGGREAGEHRGNGTCKEGDTFSDKLYEFIGKAVKGSSVQLRLYSSTHIKRSLCGDQSATWYQVEQVPEDDRYPTFPLISSSKECTISSSILPSCS
jgi:hypothetical protein